MGALQQHIHILTFGLAHFLWASKEELEVRFMIY